MSRVILRSYSFSTAMINARIYIALLRRQFVENRILQKPEGHHTIDLASPRRSGKENKKSMQKLVPGL